MAERLIEVVRRAEAHLLENRPEEALAEFYAVAKADPDHLWTRFRICTALERLKQPIRALEVYKGLAWHCIKAGHPLLGLVAIHRAKAIQGTFEGALETLADLYSLESDRIRTAMPLPNPLPLNSERSINGIDPHSDRLGAAAAQFAADFKDARYPAELPPIPLFSLLTREAFYPILEIMQRHTLDPGETIVKQGEACQSVFMLAQGEVEVRETRGGEEHSLARLPAGSVFGEMALITDAPRVASAIALADCEVLELRRDELELAAEDLDDITWALAKFTRERFVNHLMQTSPIFTPFSREARQEILERFTSVGIPTDEVVIKEGTPGPGLYIILGGEVEVSKFEGGERMHLARLPEGSVFGEISLVKDTPTTATVQAIRGGEFLFLSREDFKDLCLSKPEIKKALALMSEERLAEQRQALQIAATKSADGAVIF